MLPILLSSGTQRIDLAVLLIKNDFSSVVHSQGLYFTFLEKSYWSIKIGFLEQPLLGSHLHLALFPQQPDELAKYLYLGLSLIEVLNKTLSLPKASLKERVYGAKW